MRFIARDPAEADLLLAREFTALRQRWEKRTWLDAHQADYLIDTFTLELLAYLGHSPKNAHARLGHKGGAELVVPSHARIAGAQVLRKIESSRRDAS